MNAEHARTRLGRVTASQVHKILGENDSKFTQAGETYLYEIAAQQMTQQLPDEVSSKAIEWGNEMEPQAFAKFVKEYNPTEAIYYGTENPQFFSLMESEGFAGGSPDGKASMYNEYCMEIKCPYNSAVHVRNLELKNNAGLKKMHPDYYAQIQMNMMCMEVPYGLFISYDPRNLWRPLHVVVIEKDEEMQTKIRTKIALAKTFVKSIISNAKNQTKIEL